MNKVIKACHSHYQAQRDLIISKLDIMINRSLDENANEKAINLIKKLAEINNCISTLEIIIDDNKKDVSELDDLAQVLQQKLKEQSNTQ